MRTALTLTLALSLLPCAVLGADYPNTSFFGVEFSRVYAAVLATPSAQDDLADRIGHSTVTHANVRETEQVFLSHRPPPGRGLLICLRRGKTTHFGG